MPLRTMPFYTVTNSVGRGGANGRLDVMLVQYFLFKLWQGNPHFTRTNVNIYLPQESGYSFNVGCLFPFNGNYSKDLDHFIHFFQRWCNHMGWGPLVEDGRIDVGEVGWGPRMRGRPHRWRTINALNYIASRRCDEPWERLMQLSDFPGELKTDMRFSMYDTAHVRE